MGRLSLRLRVFLFFALLAGGALLISAGGLLFAGLRAEPALPAAPLVMAFVLFAFLNTALVLGVWLLFDENVAKPIIRLSADMRVRARGDVAGPIEAESARHLGDLAPALSDLSGTARATLQDVAAEVARETAQLGSEHERLTALLTEIPIATILLNPALEIVLYDAQAAEILSVIAPPRLKAPVSDYLETREIEAAMARLGEG
ncbi:MAG: 3'-5' exonuclease, partial [Pseudomonadota bacterium]